MKVLIMGGDGMAGHLMVRYFREKTPHSVFYTSRNQKDPGSLYTDARDLVLVRHVVEAVHPDILVNCIGILNDSAERDPAQAYHVNGRLPHLLKQVVNQVGGKLVQISTDCVFSGKQGGHEEWERPDGFTVYSRSKAMGEVKDAPHLTIRTSIVGPEIRQNGIGLLNWFLNQSGEVKGYTEAYWNGVTTLELAKFVHHVMEDTSLNGIVHLTAPEQVSKYELLQLFRKIFEKKDVELIPDSKVKLDRTLRSTRKDMVYRVPDYEQMLTELKEWMAGR
ncbi:NAD(P)-dependent oxidoreductase [Paenibacillus larvae subsp. pulvifaciens]|uniref:dTDP-4-dehydrorhamnose reductase n=1 Tax=Paenibacillus larvae subsp. pulvifaciens TaxID=1477 RepID=A0A1V0UQD6_9BACL|nr:SDR family oxidoreductase [Paenibacillus larvae]ARF67489.1 NAD(P)-dependent oxidoreductase [Paenibacillus larvae subsp. pulvifaciens]